MSSSYKGQTKRSSLYEAISNIFVGYTINFLANLAIFPLFGWHISVKQNVQLGIIYTVISLVRSYGLRRFYNWREVRRLALQKDHNAVDVQAPV